MMRKNLLAPAALLLMAASGATQAASNGEIVITANVVAATCDVNVSTSNLDLGNHTPSDFTAIGKPIPSSVKPFTIDLSNCQTPLDANDTAGLVITGQTLGGNPNMFNSTGTNTGIMLSKIATPTEYIRNTDKLNIATAGTTPDSGDFNGKTLTLQAGLASASIEADIGAVKAPILFSFAYN